MHIIQEQLLELADTEDLGSYSFYALAKKLSVPNHGSVKFHLDKLLSDGLLMRNKLTNEITKVDSSEGFKGLLSIPIMGEASCGLPSRIADDQIKDFLRISPSILPSKVKLDKLYALLAVGNSMNAAEIDGGPINDGDYVIIEKADTANDGDYVVSVFEDVANIKKLKLDENNSRVLLLSECTNQLPPIVISEHDSEVYSITGKVVCAVPSGL